MNDAIKLFLAKSSWIDYIRYYYFSDGIDDLDDSEIKDRLEFFTDHINKGLSLNKKDWIDYLIDQGWSKDENDINDTWFKNNPDFTDVNNTWFNLEENEDESGKNRNTK
ncbi:MAG: hypothetical protein O3C07_02990 [Bacteroidetes bacterium]|nr:hypothetical protein [Bacteroidota bacterium]